MESPNNNNIQGDNPNIELTLNDNTGLIRIIVDKKILINNSDYFRRMFDFGMEKNQTKITINVDNRKIAYDLVMSFYGNKIDYQDISDQLTMAKCRSYFGLKNDPKLLYDIIVKEEDFGLFLEVAGEYDIVSNQKLMMVIKKNIPEKYPLNNFSTEFIKELLKLNNRKIIAGGRDGLIKIWDDASNPLFHTLTGHTDSVWGLAFSPDGTKIASSSEDKTVNIWDNRTDQLLRTLYGHSDHVYCVAFSTDGTKIASGSYDKSIKIWDVQTGYLLYTYYSHTSGINALIFTKDDKKIISGSWDGTIKIWSTANIPAPSFLNSANNLYKKLSFTMTGKNEDFPSTLIHHAGSGGGIRAMALSPDSTKIVSGCFTTIIKIWDVDTGSLIKEWEKVDFGCITGLDFSPDGKKIVSCNDGVVKIWDTNGTLLHKLIHDYCYSVAFSSDSQQIVSGGDGIKIWDAMTGDLIDVLTNADDKICRVAFFYPIITDVDKRLAKFLDKNN